jgi:hypothetical protein
MSKRRVTTLADRDETPPRNLMTSRRAAHAVALVFSNDLAGIDSALKVLRKQRGETGLARLSRPQSTLHAYFKPGDRRRAKSGKHRAAVRKAEAKRAAYEARYEERHLWRKYDREVSAAA